LPEARAARRPTLDIIGTILAGLGMGLLIYPLIQGQRAGWPLWTYLMMAGSVVAFAALAGWSAIKTRRGQDPLIQSSIFRHRAYSTGLGAILVFFAGMIGTLLVVTLYLQLGEHFSAIHAGLTIAPFAFGMAIGATLAGALLVPRFGRRVLQVATVVMAGGIWWVHEVIAAHGLHTTSLDLIAPQLVAGAGIGMVVSPLFGFILAAVTADEVGSASGVLNAIQQLAGALGVAALGTLFFSTLGSHGFVAAITHSLVAELATMPVLLALISTLPRRAREESEIYGAAEDEPAAPSLQPMAA